MLLLHERNIDNLEKFTFVFSRTQITTIAVLSFIHDNRTKKNLRYFYNNDWRVIPEESQNLEYIIR